MINFEKKPEPKPEQKGDAKADPKGAHKPATDENRFDQIRKAALERHRKSDTDGTRRRARQTVEDNRLL